MSIDFLLARSRINHSQGAEGDPYWDKVISLCHYKGANGSTLITDEVAGVTWTAGSGSKISTDISKFGGSSLYVGPGGASTAQYLSVGTTGFTFEAWVYTSSASATQVIHKILPTFPNFVLNANNLQFSNGSAWIYATGGLVPVNQWVHVAVSYSGGKLYFFINGIMKGSPAKAVASSSGKLTVGADQSSNHLLGYMAESRVTKDVGRYTSNFTPPVSPFPNHA